MHADENSFNPDTANAVLTPKLRRFVHLLTDGTQATDSIVAAAFAECREALRRCKARREAEALLYRAALWATVDATLDATLDETGAQPRKRSLLDRFYALPLAEKAVVALFTIDDIDRDEAAQILGAGSGAVGDSLKAARAAMFAETSPSKVTA